MEAGQEIFNALGMTLIHSLWQGTIIAALVLFMLMMAGKTNARARYAIHFTGLLMLLGAFIVTFVVILRNNHALAGLQQGMLSIPPDNGIVQVLPLTPAGIAQRILSFLIPFSPYFAIFWISGFIITGIKLTGGVIVARISFTKDLVLPDNNLIELFNDIKGSMGLSSRIKLQISKRMISPLVTGIIAPMVIIPAAAITGLNVDQIRSVMIHELAHIRRYDHIFILIQAIARLILFFHPLAWYLLREIDRERENCCDDFVIRDNNPINYIKALAMIQELNLPAAPANGLTGKSNQLLKRIKRLIKPETRHTAAFRLSVIFVFVITFGTLFMAFIITEQPDVKSGRNTASEELQSASPHLSGTASTVIRDDKDGDKKKMVIVFDNDTIKEMTVNGKKLSKEEMKEYADEIRKVQRELESSQEELEGAHEELRMAHIELEKAHREFELANRNEDFHDFELRELNELNKLNHLNHPNKLNDMNKLNEMNHLNEMINNELTLHKFHLDQFQNQMQSGEFHEKMKQAQEEAMKAFEDAKEKSMEFKNSEEFREKMKKAQEEAMKAFEEARAKNKEFFNSEEFNEQLRKASEEARKAFEELRRSGGFDQEFNFNFNYDHPPAIHPFRPVPRFNGQEPPSPRPDVGTEEAPVAPEPPEVPDVEVEVEDQELPEIEEAPEVEHQEIPEIEEAPEVEQHELPEIEETPEVESPEDSGKMEIEEKQEANPKSEELDNKLRELEND